jgi:hypothetical protein
MLGACGHAQDRAGAPGTSEVTFIAAGGTFFVGDSESGFGSYNLGGAVTHQMSRYFGVEGEVSGLLGVTQNVSLNGVASNQKPPNLISYTGSVVLSAPAPRGTILYLTEGIGGLTLFQRTGLAVADDTTFLTGSSGGGVKWYANDRVGVRTDYRFMIVRPRDGAPSFFGQRARLGHRIYGGLVFNITP